ncbi:ParB-like nuclease domain protein [Gordonia phage Ligma]|nr:ParB-like nuclease domain protein [Gordonia phage Ligma]UQT02102.1 ParB-like nuclease domain protein [Gordonia phage Axumite]
MASRTKPRPTSVPPAELHTYHRNARQGDVESIAGSLKVNGQYRPIVVNVGTHTGRPNEVLAGNHTLKAFRSLGEQNPTDDRWNEILVHWVDVDDDRAARIVLADNRTAEKGGYDHEMLLEVVDSLGGDLDGTGFSVEDLDELEKLASGGGAPGSGDLMDPPDEDNYTQQYAVTVVCADEAEQEAVFERLSAEGLTCKVVTV